jgi:hypothetical protein
VFNCLFVLLLCLFLCTRSPPPPIPFVSKVKKVYKVDGPDAGKSELINLEFLMDPDNPAFKYSSCYLQGWMPRRLDQAGDGLP